jgi:enoyl-CoA hydratase/carnithine racemase
MDSMTPAEEGTTPVLTVDGWRANIRLNRPAQHNRLEPADIAAMRGILADIDTREEIRVVVITGTGKSFSSGYHLGELGSTERTQGDSGSVSAFEQMTDAVENLRAPTICALNGGVYGGSTDLALACDFRIGVDSMRMFMPAARLGLHYYPGGLRRYVTRLGLSAAKRLFLTAETVEAQELLRIGYLDEVVPPERLWPRVDALAATLSDMAPIAVQGMKRAMNQIARGEYDRDAIEVSYRQAQESQDIKEGLAAWAAKRKPVFRGC